MARKDQMKDYYTRVYPDWESWVWPDGPWGWNEDGTSAAPTAVERRHHINWYHDSNPEVSG